MVEPRHIATGPGKVETGIKLRGAEKVARIPVKIIPTEELSKIPRRHSPTVMLNGDRRVLTSMPN